MKPLVPATALSETCERPSPCGCASPTCEGKGGGGVVKGRVAGKLRGRLRATAHVRELRDQRTAAGRGGLQQHVARLDVAVQLDALALGRLRTGGRSRALTRRAGKERAACGARARARQRRLVQVDEALEHAERRLEPLLPRERRRRRGKAERRQPLQPPLGVLLGRGIALWEGPARRGARPGSSSNQTTPCYGLCGFARPLAHVPSSSRSSSEPPIMSG